MTVATPMRCGSLSGIHSSKSRFPAKAVLWPRARLLGIPGCQVCPCLANLTQEHPLQTIRQDNRSRNRILRARNFKPSNRVQYQFYCKAEICFEDLKFLLNFSVTLRT